MEGRARFHQDGELVREGGVEPKGDVVKGQHRAVGYGEIAVEQDHLVAEGGVLLHQPVPLIRGLIAGDGRVDRERIGNEGQLRQQ